MFRALRLRLAVEVTWDKVACRLLPLICPPPEPVVVSPGCLPTNVATVFSLQGQSWAPLIITFSLKERTLNRSRPDTLKQPTGSRKTTTSPPLHPNFEGLTDYLSLWPHHSVHLLAAFGSFLCFILLRSRCLKLK